MSDAYIPEFDMPNEDRDKWLLEHFDELQAVQRNVAATVVEINRLRAAIVKYGQHEDDCNIFMSWKQSEQFCDCGLIEFIPEHTSDPCPESCTDPDCGCEGRTIWCKCLPTDPEALQAMARAVQAAIQRGPVATLMTPEEWAERVPGRPYPGTPNTTEVTP